jgi:hypothetical protein
MAPMPGMPRIIACADDHPQTIVFSRQCCEQSVTKYPAMAIA